MLFVAFASLLGGCGLFDSGEVWRSGRFAVRWIDIQQNMSLGYDMGGGSSFGVVEPCAFAIGSNSRFIAAARIPRGGSPAVVYVVSKAQYDPMHDDSGAVSGPFAEQTYAVMERTHGFPSLSELIPRGRCSSGA